MYRLLFAAVAWLSLSGTGAVAGLEISQPPDEVAPGDDVELIVSGINYQQLPQATLRYFPRNQVRVRGTLSWGLEPRIDFRARLPGEYLVFVSATIDGKNEYSEVIIVVGDKPPDPPPPPPPPPPSDLSAFVADLIEELDIETGTSEVAGFFQDAVPKVDSDELRGSKAIVEAVTKRIAAMNSTKWKAFSSLLYGHLLNELQLVSQSQWSDAYKEVVLGLGGVKP
jgi:hypothetical protein